MVATLGDGPDLLSHFGQLRSIVREQARLVVNLFPEYTPHDASNHLEKLFELADRILGAEFYENLTLAEMSLLVFGLYAHDWGMAVGNEERDAISGVGAIPEMAVLVPGEPDEFVKFRTHALRTVNGEKQVWEDYLRQTHALRSGQRLRMSLKAVSQVFAEMVARVAEGHALDFREIQSPDLYPVKVALFGQVANVAAIAVVIRLVDLLDLAEDRTPFALWSIVGPRNKISRMEWKKHRALAPVAVSSQGVRQILITGTTEDPDVFAALADLRSWVDDQFSKSVEFLRNMGSTYDPKLDSSIKWNIQAVGFEPVLLRFDFDRPAALGLLSSEIYGSQKLTFVRELLQNSVDAIDTRVDLLRQTDTPLQGQIAVKITTLFDRVRVTWTDNGVGMDRHILENYFTKIGSSWYQSADFQRHAFSQDPISRFGIGLLSCFGVSSGLTVTTRREPRLTSDTRGWHIAIPSRDGYFRVTEAKDEHIGTTVEMDVTATNTGITAMAIADTLKELGALVKYPMVIDVDGLVEQIAPPADNDDPRLPFLRIEGLKKDAIAKYQSLIVQFNHRFRSNDGSYEAFFSSLLPRNGASLTSMRYDGWTFGAETFDFDELIIHRPRKLFFKGIANVIEPKPEGLATSDLTSIVLNILKPSLVRPSLSRADVNLQSLDLTEAWRDAALHIREIIGLRSQAIEDQVLALSSALKCVHMPFEALTDLVSTSDWPMWMLNYKSEPSWRRAKDLLASDHILEAPDELEDLFVIDNYVGAAVHNMMYWTGPACFVHASSPWSRAAASLTRRFLETVGFTPTDLQFVESPSGDAVPLACLVWRKQSKYLRPSKDEDLVHLLAEWRKNPTMEYPQLVKRAIAGHASFGNAPTLVRFPDGMNDVAAVGNLYWNQNNLHIRPLVETLLQLAVRFQAGNLSGKNRQAFRHLNSTDYLGFFSKAARYSDARNAIDRYRELINIAKDEGITPPNALGPEDFLAGSIGDRSRSAIDLVSLWSKSKTPVGTPWIASQQ